MFTSSIKRAHYETPVPVAIHDKPRMIKYRRRVLNYSRLQNVSLTGKRAQLSITYLLVGTFLWAALGEDWGENDHGFRTLREYVSKRKDEFYQLTQEDIEELKYRNKI